MNIRHRVRSLLWNLGIDLSRVTASTNHLARRKLLIQSSDINTVIDVGANTGQFGVQLRQDLKYRGKIVSFEPLKDAYRQLESTARPDKDWLTFNCALGESSGIEQINVAGNSFSSSILAMEPLHLDCAPESKYIGKESIEVKTLDSMFQEICGPGANTYLKIDTQGFEEKVLRGARQSLPKIAAVQLEMSISRMYAGELLIADMITLMQDMGYTLVSLEDGFCDPTSGRQLQVDGVFMRLPAPTNI